MESPKVVGIHKNLQHLWESEVTDEMEGKEGKAYDTAYFIIV